MAMELPRFFALESIDVSEYLRHLKGSDADHPDIRCTGKEVVSPYTKFESVVPKMDNNDRGLVHIRCCYNNKYWVKESEEGDMITPRATEPEEDDTKWSCTLFEPIYNMEGTTLQVQLNHVQLGQPLYVFTGSRNCIRVNPDTSAAKFTVIDWQSLLVLPKQVALKRPGGQYLNVLNNDGDLVFMSDDGADATVGQEVVTTRDGSIRLKPNCLDKYWHRDVDNQVRVNCDSDDLFQPIQVADNMIALRSLSNNMYCRSYKDGDKYYLIADMPTICRDSRLEVVELVLSRSIYNVVFHEEDGRIYDETMTTMASGEVVNQTDVDDNIELKLSYTDTQTMAWNFSGSLTLGVKYTMKAGVPLICGSKIKVSASITLGVQYTTTTTTTRLAETVYRVHVPAHTRVKVSLKATQGKCDVPYSYTQCDTFFNGQTETYRKDDGVFTGTNCYHLSYYTEEEALT
ncbi:hypothetical protein MKW94_007286 [Papaver nudicaule]|uniref:Agglutinin domain-containing protein n=1 Tax=Papaver nudicaule TaxID=74823 RepID=A0AA41V4F8_PAPNU|nr:hypothetical protein [Papaver nudicaule]